MAKYGNILTVFNCDNIQKEGIKTILSEKGADYENKDDVFYIKSNSKTNTREIIQEITAIEVEFIFFHNHISDGSLIKSFGLDSDTVGRINRILFEE